MKNGTLVTAYLDFCATLDTLSPDERSERIIGDEGAALWFAALDGGWTVAELDAAYTRRFGRAVNRPQSEKPTEGE